MEEDFVKQLFTYINASADHHLASADNLKEFLGFIARMQSNITVSNKILAYGYDPTATDIHTREEWESFGITVLDENAVIYNLQHQPDSQYGYVERVMYDISSTNAKLKIYEQFPNAGFFAERLILSSPCPIQFCDGPIAGSRKVFLDTEKGIIEATRGFKNEEQVCHGLLREFAHYYLREREMDHGSKGKDKRGNRQTGILYDRDKHGVEAQAVSYAVCTRYGITPPVIDVLSPPEGSSEDRRRVLEGLDYSVWSISQRIEECGKQQRKVSESDNHVRGQPVQGRG